MIDLISLILVLILAFWAACFILWAIAWAIGAVFWITFALGWAAWESLKEVYLGERT